MSLVNQIPMQDNSLIYITLTVIAPNCVSEGNSLSYKIHTWLFDKRLYYNILQEIWQTSLIGWRFMLMTVGHDYMQHRNTDLHHYDNTRLAREHNISIIYLFNSLRMMSTFNKFTMQ